jgi:predicted permease
MMMQALIRPPRAGYSGEMNPDLLKVRTNRWLFTLGRMKAGVTRRQVESSLKAVLTASDRALKPGSPEHAVTAWAVDEGVPGQRAPLVSAARLLMSVTGAVLLIACANVANLLLSRATARRREIAVRLAIGAGRARILRQLLTESVLLAMLGGGLGVAVAWATVSAFGGAAPPGALPVAFQFAIDVRVLAFTLALSVATGIVFGLAPALRASREDLVPALKDESFVPDARARRVNLKKALVVGEVALSLALLVAASLFVRSLQRSRAIDPGVDADRLLSAPLNVNLLRYTRAQGREFYARVVERVEALPGVERASVARVPVLFGGGSLRSLHIEGREGPADQYRSDGTGVSAARNREAVSSNVIGPGYFQTLGIGLLRGRDFSIQDREDAPPSVIVNRAFVEMHFTGQEALGKRFSVNGPAGPWREIVGVVEDSKYLTLREERTPIAYLPLGQNHETGVTLHVRAADPAASAPLVRREIQALEPNLPVAGIQTMNETIRTSLYPARMLAVLLSAFGGLAMLLAAIGVYGVMAFSISRRTRELGIRAALGAGARDVLALVIREGMLLVGIGIGLGLAAAAVAARGLGSFLYGLGPLDAVSFLTMPVALAIVALVACYLPARRATRIDPVVALRQQ